MKIKHKLLPLLAIGSTAAIVTPFVTSCSKTINIEMEWSGVPFTQLEAEHEIVANQIYRIHIDMAKFDSDFTAEAKFNFSMTKKTDTDKNESTFEPDEHRIWLDGKRKDMDCDNPWTWETKQLPSLLTGFKTNANEITKTSQIDIEIVYYSTSEYTPFTGCFSFKRAIDN